MYIHINVKLYVFVYIHIHTYHPTVYKLKHLTIPFSSNLIEFNKWKTEWSGNNEKETYFIFCCVLSMFFCPLIALVDNIIFVPKEICPFD